MLNKTPLSGLPVNTQVTGWFYFQQGRTLTSSVNTNYLAWEGLDATGSVVRGTYYAQPGQVLPQYVAGDVLAVSGSIGDGKAGVQVWAKSMNKVQEPDAEAFRAICIPTVPEPELTQYITDLKAYSQSIVDPELLRLSTALFEYLEPFLRLTPAGRQNHEPQRGGLAKHTWKVLGVLNNPIILNWGINRDVLIFSALYHDLGKTKEYTSEMAYAPAGRLLPHSDIALMLITQATTMYDIRVNPQLLLCVQHCLTAHHGKWSEVHPLTREAFALYYADELASKMGHFDEVLRRGGIGNDGWAPYSIVVEGYPYIPQADNRGALFVK